MISLSDIHVNPNNPQIVDKDKIDKLKKSIEEFEKMMSLRPIVIDSDNMILGGNKRYTCLIKLGYKEVPEDWVKKAQDLTEEEKRRFIIMDNVGFGEWDYELLQSEWDVDELSDWGLDIIEFEEEKEKEEKPKVKNHWTPDCLFESNNLYDIPSLIIQKSANVHLPFIAFGSEKRHGSRVIGTYHFYVDDYRFQKIWDDPNVLLESGMKAMIEPNISLFDTTPIAYGLHLIYKKRWLARYMQSYDVEIFIDLNVSKKFLEHALIGVPKGWGQYATRGYAERIDDLKEEYNLAKQHHDGNPESEFRFVVYGGGKKVKELCAELNVVFIEQYMKK